MDRRGCSSYTGFDGCDPFESVIEWSGRGERAARVLRRRCRSEGVERSPYDDAHAVYDTEYSRHQKTYFTLNHCQERFHHECVVPVAENGDYLMAHEHRRSHSGKSKPNRLSPTQPLVVTSANGRLGDSRLPKVEELLEKFDQEMMEVSMAKQPLKSILNNPIPKSPPQGILKKPKPRTYQDPKFNVEGRRRQRASSESDNLITTSHLGAPIPGYDSRLTYLSPNTKRAKDNSGTGYSYGSAIASLSPPVKSPNYTKNRRCSCKDQVVVKGQHDGNEVHILRTTAINYETVNEEALAKPKLHVPPPIRPETPSARAPHPAPPSPKCKSPKKKCKPKSPRKKVVAEGGDDSPCSSPSPIPMPDAPTFDASWQMETDALIAEIHKLEAPNTVPSIPAAKKEDNATKLPARLTNGAGVTAKKVSVKEDSPLTIPGSVTSCLRPSLFPRVPPYLRFVSHDEAAPLKIPVGIAKHLKWKLTTITPIVVKKTLMNSGFRLVKSDCDTSECPQEETVEWIGIWGKHMKSLMFRAIKDGQKMNHFPGTFQIGRKDRLWRNLQKLTCKFGEEEFGIMPKTYVLPHDMKLLKHDWERHAANNEKWIIKPPASARGTGIKVVSRWTQIPKKRPVVVQRYVNKPYLINGSKFDMRLYVLVTSMHPLRIYMYRDGLARFASVKYNDEIASLNDRYMHLTNYSINRLSKNYTPNEDFAACEGHKWTLLSLFQYLKTEKHVDTDALWESMKDLVIKTIISGEASISSLTKANVTSRYNCYELFGIDVLLDEDLKPWLLEVNISPSLHSASPLDIHVKGPLVSTVLNVAQFQVPIKTNLESLTREKPNKLAGLPYDCRLYTVYLSKEERDKHIIYTNMEDRDMYLRDVLSTLTPDDVRHLIQAEDELSACGADMQRIFPHAHTHRYLPYLTGPRYYNRLFDAWETRYANHRENGLELLRTLCDIGYHLEVPPVPLKLGAGALSALDRCRMTWTCRRPSRASAPRCSRSRWSPRAAPRRPPPPATPRRLRPPPLRRPPPPSAAPAPSPPPSPPPLPAPTHSDKPVDLNRNETADHC